MLRLNIAPYQIDNRMTVVWIASPASIVIARPTLQYHYYLLTKSVHSEDLYYMSTTRPQSSVSPIQNTERRTYHSRAASSLVVVVVNNGGMNEFMRFEQFAARCMYEHTLYNYQTNHAFGLWSRTYIVKRGWTCRAHANASRPTIHNPPAHTPAQASSTIRDLSLRTAQTLICCGSYIDTTPTYSHSSLNGLRNISPNRTYAICSINPGEWEPSHVPTETTAIQCTLAGSPQFSRDPWFTLWTAVPNDPQWIFDNNHRFAKAVLVVAVTIVINIVNVRKVVCDPRSVDERTESHLVLVLIFRATQLSDSIARRKDTWPHSEDPNFHKIFYWVSL